MKSFLRSFTWLTCLIFIFIPSVAAAAAFPYPSVPDSIASFSARADYFVTHFWDRADIKKVFSNQQELKMAIRDYVEMMPHASASANVASISEIMSRLNRMPQQQAFVANAAVGYMYGDTALFWSDELVIPFAEAVSSNKKAPTDERNRMAEIARLLKSNVRGAIAPNPVMTHRGDEQKAVYEPNDSVTYQVLFFCSPKDNASDMIRMKLNADYLVSKLTEAGIIKITSVYPGEPDSDEFRTLIAKTPSEWIAGALPQARAEFDVRALPSFYLLTGKGFLVEKNLSYDGLLSILYKLRRLKAAQPSARQPENELTEEEIK